MDLNKCPECGESLIGSPVKRTAGDDSNAYHFTENLAVVDGELCLLVAVECDNCQWSDERVLRGELQEGFDDS